MKIRAEHIMIIVASIPYIYGMAKMILELKPQPVAMRTRFQCLFHRAGLSFAFLACFTDAAPCLNHPV